MLGPQHNRNLINYIDILCVAGKHARKNPRNRATNLNSRRLRTVSAQLPEELQDRFWLGRFHNSMSKRWEPWLAEIGTANFVEVVGAGDISQPLVCPLNSPMIAQRAQAVADQQSRAKIEIFGRLRGFLLDRGCKCGGIDGQATEGQRP